MMGPEEREEFLLDGLSGERRERFTAGAAAVREWERRHAWSLDAYIDFLDSMQAALGPFLVDRLPWTGSDFRL